MMDHFEKRIKKSLEEFEVTYNSEAWKRLRKELDRPQSGVINGSQKWLLGGSVLFFGILSVTLLFLNNEPKKIKTDIIKPISSAQQKTNFNAKKEKKVNPNGTQSIVSKSMGESHAMDVDIKQNIVNPSNQQTVFSNEGNSRKETNDFDNNKVSSNTISTYSNSKFIIPQISDVCLGENVSIHNQNNEGFHIQFKKEKLLYVRGKQSLSFKPQQEGNYEIIYSNNGNSVSESLFKVLQTPSSAFNFNDQVTYENGLPTIRLDAEAYADSYQWSIDGYPISEQDKTISIHLFKRGNYHVNLSIESQNGCRSNEEKNIRIDEDYNLLAVNAFNPNTNDAKRNCFMPFALTQRTTEFMLTIIDPKDGSIIFETNDTSNPWRGIDQRTNTMVNTNSTYIWKVIISSPLKGEKSMYQGTITRL